MRKQGKKAIMYIMTILLVWSMVVPSLAFAENEITTFQLKNSANEDMIVDYFSIFEKVETENGSYITTLKSDSNSDSNTVQFNGKVNPQSTYYSLWSILLGEDQKRVVFSIESKGEDLEKGWLEVPQLDSLKEIELNLESDNNYNVSLVLEYAIGDDAFTVDASFNRQYNKLYMQEKDFLSSALMYFVNQDVYIDSQGKDISSYRIKDKSMYNHVQTDVVEGERFSVGVKGYNHTMGAQKEIYLGSGIYDFDFERDNEYWSLTKEITNDTNIVKPSEVFELESMYFSAFQMSETMYINNQLMITSNDFQLSGNVELDRSIYLDNQEVYSDKINRFGSAQIDFKDFASGEYTYKITYKGKSFEEKFSYKNSSVPEQDQVSIVSPVNDTFSNEETIMVSGTGNKSSNVTITLEQGESVIDTKSVVSNENGLFSTTFIPTKDGTYTIRVVQGEAEATRTITIDRTAPEKATGVTLVHGANGLVATWEGAEDAVAYDVELSVDTGLFTKVATAQTETTYTIDSVEPNKTYKVQIASYDKAGNKSVSEAVEYKVDDFVISEVIVEDIRSPYGLLPYKAEVVIKMKGSYKEGYVAGATIPVSGEGDGIVNFEYNKELELYEGKLLLSENSSYIGTLTASIADGDRKIMLDKELNWNVGAKVVGKVTDGTPVANQTVRLTSDKHTITTKTNDKGEFVYNGIPAGDYTPSIYFDGKTYTFDTVEVEAVKENVIEKTLELPSLVQPTITFKDKNQEVINTALDVRISNATTNFTAYGTIDANGQFVSYNGKVLPKLLSGTYDVLVYGKQLFVDTKGQLEFNKSTTDYSFVVNKLDFEESTINFTLPDGITSVDYVSIWSPGVAEKSNYVLNGNYFDQPTADDLKAVKVVAAKDYQIYIHKDGYKPFRLSNKDLSTNQTIEVDLVEGLKISGTVTHEGSPVNGIQVYASGSESYASAVTNDKGEYTLTGLGKDEEITLNVFNNGIYVNYSEEIGKLADHITDREIKLSKAVNVGGKVLDADQNPLSNVSIYVTATDSQFSTWSRTATDGTFLVTGLVDNKEYTFTYSTYGLPDVTETISDLTNEQVVVMQHEPKGSLSGEGNAFAVNKSLAAPGEDVTYTLTYKNNGEAELTNVPVTLKLDSNLELVAASALLNGKPVTVSTNTITIPTVAAGESGTISFKATVNSNADVSTLTSTVDVTNGEDKASYNATTNLVFVNLNAPAQTGAKKVKVYGTAKKGATVEIYQGQKLLASTKVDSKYYYADVTLDLADDTVASNVSLTAKVIDGSKVVYSKPVQIAYQPTLPVIEDVTVYAGWNGNVKLNPYTGLATFAITEHTPMDTTVSFKANSEVKSMTLHFLGKDYAMIKAGDTFTFNGQELGKWSSYGEQLLEVTYTTKEDVKVRVPLMNIIVLIDPSGYVFEGSMDNRLEGVQAVVETRANADSPWVKWDAQKFGQINPQITDEEGRYGWDVITGQWRVVFTKDGYIPYISRVMDVPPVETELNIPMVKAADPALKTTEIKANNLTVEFDRPMVVNPSNFELYKVNGEDRTKVEITVTANNDLNGYKSLVNKPAGKSSVVNDSNNEVGFFDTDNTFKVAQSFTIAPKAKLDADATFELVVKGAAKDAEGRTLGLDTTFTFETDAAPVVSPPTTNPPVVTPPTDDVVVIEDGKVVVSKDKLEELFASPEARIGLDLTKVTGNVLPPVLFDSEALSKMKATQSIVLQLPNQQVELPAAVLQALAKEGGQVELKVEEVTSKESGAISSQLNFNMTTYKDGKATAQTKFAAPITVSMKLNKTPTDPRKVAVFYVNGDAKTYMGGDVKDGMVTFTTDHFSSFVAVEGNKTFTDLPAYAKEAVEVLASRGIINGKTDTRYGSGDSITRAEFAVLVARSLALPTESYKGTFTDVPASMKWAAQHIEAANQAGIINGYNETTFKPGEKINRQEMAAMIVRALKYQNPDITVDESKFVNFLDSSDISSFAKKDVAMASAMGIINGFKSGNGYEFRPKQTATRGEAAKMLFEMLY